MRPTSPMSTIPQRLVMSEPGLEGDDGSSITWSIDIPSGLSRFEVVLEEEEFGSQLADLFVRRGSQASISELPYNWTADCASVRPNRETEVCAFDNPQSGTYYITIYGYHAYWGAKLTATISQ